MKTTLQSLNFPVPIILIPRELNSNSFSELTIELANLEYLDKYPQMFGYYYRRADTDYVIQNGVSLQNLQLHCGTIVMVMF